MVSINMTGAPRVALDINAQNRSVAVQMGPSHDRRLQAMRVLEAQSKDAFKLEKISP